LKKIYKISELKPLRRKRSYIIADEDIYIDRLEINIKDKEKKLEIIRDHLTELFDDISDIIFHAENIKLNKKNFLFLYCIRCSNDEIVKSISKGKIKLIPIQFYVHKKYKNKLKKENCAMIFEKDDSLYVNFIKDKKIYDSSIFREYTKGILDKRLVEIEDFVGDKKNIFFINNKNKLNRYDFHEFYSKMNVDRIEG